MDAYRPRVSFNTLEKAPHGTHMASFTLQAKSKGYAPTRHTRSFLCFTALESVYCEALDWALKELLSDGDELVVCRVLERVVPQREIERSAQTLLRKIEEKSQAYDPSRKLSLTIELSAGKLSDVLDRLVPLYRPESVIVGATLRRVWYKTHMNLDSIAKCCLTLSPVPIIVIRPAVPPEDERTKNPRRLREDRFSHWKG